MSRERKFDIFTGATSGIIKGIKVGATKKENRIKNFLILSALITESDRVTRIAWGDENEQEVLVGCGKNEERIIKIFDADSGILTHSFPCNAGKGSINGISRYNESILTSVESGTISLFSPTGKGEELVNLGKNLSRMCHSRVKKNVIATGGMANEVKLYDVEKQQLIFVEKNLPNDWLELRRPVWVSDLNFLPRTQEIVSVSRYGDIRLYDPRSQRRAVLDMTVKNEAWTSLAIPPKEKHIIAGSTTGKLNLIDLRKPGTVLNTYKGFSGGVTGVSCSTTNPYVASVSLDRYLRIHNINTKELLKCIYLTSRLSCLIMRSDMTVEIEYEDGTEA